MIKKWLKKVVSEVILEGFEDSRKQMQEEVASALHDITYRINVLKEAEKGGHRIHTSDLNIATHMLDGYVFTNNSPAAGSVAWADVNIVYKGQTYTITNGNTTYKYIFWQFSATDKTKLQTSNTKPILTQDDILIGVNDGGIFTLTMAPGKLTPGSALLDGSVGTNELGTNAVTTAKIAASAITTNELASGAVTEVKLGANAVTTAKIASNAVTANELSNGAVTNAKLASGAVDSGKLADSAVTTAKIAGNAIDSSKIASGAVGSTQLASGAVTSGKIASNAVNSSNLIDGAVTGSKIGAGAVAEDKLNVATHFLF